MSEDNNVAIETEKKHQSDIEKQKEYIEKFDILETINNVGNDEIFTPAETCRNILKMFPREVWSEPNNKWLVPCDKNGVFLREIALKLDEGLKDIIKDEETRKKHILKDMLFSIGLTQFTTLVSRRTVYYCTSANRKPDGELDRDGHSYRGYAIGNGEWFDDEEGNILSPIGEHVFANGRCKYCNTSANGRYVDKSQIEHYAYEFIHVDKDDLEKHLQDRFFKGDRDMKFDIIIGNPPYQLDDDGAGASATPIYNRFIDCAKALNPKYIAFIIPARWMAGGKVPEQFRKDMITDTHIRELHDFLDFKDCFPNTDIDLMGGTCYFLWDRDYHGKCDIYTHAFENPEPFEHTTRYLAEPGYYNDKYGMNVFIRLNSSLEIYKRISDTIPRKENTEENKKMWFSSIVSERKPFKLPTDAFSKSKELKLPDFKDEPFSNSLKVYGSKGKVKYIDRDGFTAWLYDKQSKKDKTDRVNDIDRYKVFLPRANGSGTVGEVLTTKIIGDPIIGLKGEICTETYLLVGTFDTEEEARNCQSYIKTKTFRLLLNNKKITQDNPSDTFDLIPMQDFKKWWTDADLYKKYNLDSKMQKFIEDSIQEMN